MPNFRHRLTRAQQREYDRSNAVSSVPLRVSARCARAVQLLEWALGQGDRPRVERVAQVMCDEMCAALRVPTLRGGGAGGCSVSVAAGSTAGGVRSVIRRG